MMAICSLWEIYKACAGTSDLLVLFQVYLRTDLCIEITSSRVILQRHGLQDKMEPSTDGHVNQALNLWISEFIFSDFLFLEEILQTISQSTVLKSK